ncbi:hypothetical protein [Anatilimnocola aggregata]|uniref:hypothetical protein n=1 Tax=Anatilimnocola aggregata TaxID=2528021 RepID=UPI0011A5A7F3|nr:hypothetical protein [Anatilimnocola aggregata]
MRWPLPPLKDQSLGKIQLRQARKPVKSPDVCLANDPAIAELIAYELLPENRIECVTDLRGADPLVTAIRESLSHRDPDEYGRVSRRYDFAAACFEVGVSKGNIQRALLLLQSLVKAFKSRGYELLAVGTKQKDAKVRVLDREFRISVWEPSNRRTRELTKQEKLEAERWRWSRPRDYEHVPSGILEVHLDRDSYYSTGKIADTKKARVEDRLNELVVDMLHAVDAQRQQAERERLEAIAKENRRRKSLELEIVRRTESVREERLHKVVPRWHKSEQIKQYIAAVRQEALRRTGQIDDESELGRWLRWAESYLDSIAPLSENRALPTFSLTDKELAQLTRECEDDWVSYLESFRPRQPR